MNSLQHIETVCRSKIPNMLICVRDDDTASYRKITLQDILLCLGHEYAIDGDGYFLKDNEHSSHEKLYIVGPTVRYNLNLSPYDQEESVLEFISKNI